MKQYVMFCGPCLAACLLPLVGWPHPSARLHERDIRRVFAGYDNPAFPKVVRLVSSGMDAELPRRFRAEIGPVPGNHRLLGHGWTFGDAIPRRVFDAIERRHPGASPTFVELWRRFSGGIVMETSRLTGLDRRQAQALDALVHDVHLLGDRTPDNKLVADVLTTEEIARNMIRQMQILWPHDADFVREAQASYQDVQRTVPTESGRAVALLQAIETQRWGERLNGCRGGVLVPVRNRTTAHSRLSSFTSRSDTDSWP